MDLRRGHFLVKMCAKTKELGPIGGGERLARPPPLDPPMICINMSCQVETVLQSLSDYFVLHHDPIDVFAFKC